MATIRSMSERALRQLGELASGDDITTDDGDIALEAYQALFEQLVAQKAFGVLVDTLQTGLAYEAGENERVIGAASVTLPSTITEDGVVRAPKDRSVVVVAGATPAIHVYDADLAAWVAIRNLTLDSEAPLSNRFRDGLTAMLAVSLASEFGSIIPPSVADRAIKGRNAIKRRDAIRARSVESALLRANPSGGLSGELEPSVDVTTIGTEVPDLDTIFREDLT